MSEKKNYTGDLIKADEVTAGGDVYTEEAIKRAAKQSLSLPGINLKKSNVKISASCEGCGYKLTVTQSLTRILCPRCIMLNHIKRQE